MDSNKLHHIMGTARERHRVCTTQIGKWEYLRFKDTFRSVPEGTAVFGDTVVWGYPKIGRIVWLDTGVAAQFQHAFWVEEKIDGYNVRIFRLGEDLLALTRRGYVCPFTTDRLGDLMDPRVFDHRPELVFCAEVAGPENPYNEGSPPFIGEDIQLFIFDVMGLGHSGFLPHPEKVRLLEDYGLPGVPQFGRCGAGDLEGIRATVLRLDREGREGIVLKEDSRRDRRVKYVTGSINVSDIRASEGSIRQLPAEYYMHRVLRLVLFLEEHGIPPNRAIYQDLGESLIAGTRHAIEQCRHDHQVYHRHRCRFRQRANAELMMGAMKRLLGRGQVRLHRLEKEGDFHVLEFDKVRPKTTDVLNHLLAGGVLYD